MIRQAKPYLRHERLGDNLLEILKKEVWARHGYHYDLTRIRLSKDFKYADVYVRGDKAKLEILQTEGKDIIQAIKHSWNAKYLPTLRFHEDIDANRLDYVNAILDKLSNEHL
ncbi:MAG: ribosome-binding factor A [Alphaproteobacteria bacterium]|nr:MAG: ribosome-binding factor A [Alphaproteobacteria bacterium]